MLCACGESAQARSRILERLRAVERDPPGLDASRLRLSDRPVLDPEIVGSCLRGDSADYWRRRAMIAPDQGTFKLENPWPRIGWSSAAGLIVISAVLGFVVLSRYQQNDPTLDIWGAICRGLGITADRGPAAEPKRPVRTPTNIARTSSTLDQIAAGNAQ